MSEEALSASLEDYLEAIFHIVQEKQAAKAKNISDKLNVNNSSVTGALHALKERVLINYAPYDVITLTPKGKKLAREIVRRHNALRDFFVEILGVNREEAESAACGMEHSMSRPVLERLAGYVNYIRDHPTFELHWDKAQLAFEARESVQDSPQTKANA